MNFISELKRRNVIRMAGLYLVGAWLITQVAATLLPVFEAPTWAMKTIVGILAIGFFPAMVFAWIFELTPDGLKRDSEIPEAQSIAPQTARKMERTILLLFAIALAFFGVDKFYLAPKREAAAINMASENAKAQTLAEIKTSVSEKSIAVLPFVNMSADKDNEYFSDGISEEILNALTKVDDLKVAGRTSSFYFKGRNEPLQTIGKTLGVAHVLEGSVRKQGDKLRITAQLIRVGDGFHLWSETFDGTDADIFSLQEKVARKVADELKVAMNLGAEKRLVNTGTKNSEAYALYLKANDVFNRRNAAEFNRAMKLLEEATRLDPNFARAYSKLAAMQILSPQYLGADLATSIKLAQANSRRSLALQPNFAEPRTVIAFSFDLQKRYLDARAEYEKALAIDPDDLLSNFWFSTHLMETGYLGERVARLQRVLALDPLLPNALNHFGASLEWRGNLEGARQAMESAKGGGSANSDLTLAFVSLRQGRNIEATSLRTASWTAVKPAWWRSSAFASLRPCPPRAMRVCWRGRFYCLAMMSWRCR